MTTGLRFVAVLALLAGPTHALAGAFTPGAPGQQLAAACASCHAPSGRDAGVPPVAGLDRAYITRVLLAYRAGTRPGQIMQVVAQALSPQQIEAVARYLANQPIEGERP